MQFLLPLVVKTTNLKAQTRMNSEVKASHLLIYKGKVLIGSFGCRNDCLIVHFNCRKRRNTGFPPWNRSCIILAAEILATYRSLMIPVSF